MKLKTCKLPIQPLRDAIIDDFGSNPPSGYSRMVKLVDVPARSRRARRLAITLNLDESKQRGANTMRCVFTATLSVDIDVDDDPLRKAFIDMMCNNTRGLYGPASMLAKNPPELGLSITTRSGKKPIPLFEEATAGEDD